MSKKVIYVVSVNIYSFLRVSLLWPLYLLVEVGNWKGAFWLFTFMVFTDITDGALAGLLKARTELGALLDIIWDFLMVLGAGLIIVNTIPYGYTALLATLIVTAIFQPMLWAPLLWPSFEKSLPYAIAQAAMAALFIVVGIGIATIYSWRAYGEDVVPLWIVAVVLLLTVALLRWDDKIKGEWLKPLIEYFSKEPLS